MTRPTMSRNKREGGYAGRMDGLVGRKHFRSGDNHHQPSLRTTQGIRKNNLAGRFGHRVMRLTWRAWMLAGNPCE